MIVVKCLRAARKLSQYLLLSTALTVSYYACADQQPPELQNLFEQLKRAASGQEAASIENEIWQRWLDAPDENATFLMFQISRAMSDTESLGIALHLSNQLVDSNPRYAEAWNKRATVHYLLGDDAASVADIEKTLDLEPRHFGAISGLGLIFLRQNDLHGAKKAFEEVLSISPMSQQAKASLERVRRALEREI